MGNDNVGLLSDAQHWRFVGGQWRQDQSGVIQPPANVAAWNLAFWTKNAYGDFQAEYEFRWDQVWTDAALIFRAADARHYYMVNFPVVGQQYRAEHFWAAISKVDESGYVEVLKMELVHGVSSTPQVWHQARVQVTGNEIRLWVDGRPFSVVTDATYAKAGYVGLASYSALGATAKSSFRNLRVRGEARPGPGWNATLEPAQNYFVVAADHGKSCGNMVRAANGDLLMGADGGSLRRSSDNGRTWSQVQPLSPSLQTAPFPPEMHNCTYFGLLHCPRKGPLSIYVLKPSPPFELFKAHSMDHGRSWSEPVKVGEATFPADHKYTASWASDLKELQDGSLLLVGGVSTVAMSDPKIMDGRRYSRVMPPGAKSICLRSTDMGQSWSDPIMLDGPPYSDAQWMVEKEGSEVGIAQTREGRILSLTRPFSSPFMWESWSEDGGRTWSPQARGPFPMYGCDRSTLSTASGVLLVGGRFPGLAVQVSHDDGMSWKCYQIDVAAWANGAMFEVEPDVVLFLYGGLISPEELRGQLLQITPSGIRPFKPTKASK